MAKDLTSLREKLLKKIMKADSAEAIERFISAAMHTLDEHHVHGHLIVRFLDKLKVDAETKNQADATERERSNIECALGKLKVLRKDVTEKVA